VPVLAKGKTRTGRLWTYVRDDRPFAGPDPPAAMFFYSRDRGGEHPEQHLASYAGLMQADAYAGFSKLYEKMPGSYPYRYGASVLSAIALAGGVAVLEQMQGTSISDFLFADERLRILESTRRALIIRRARLEAQRDGARTFEALLTVSTPLGVPRNRSAGARSVYIVQSGLSAAKLLGSSRGRLQAPQDLPDPCGRLRRFERGAWGL
jgi:hypothetical protein